MTRRMYAGGAQPTTLAAPITTGSSTATLTAAVGYPDASSGPFQLTLGKGTATEEKVLISARSGTSITFGVRGYDGTIAQNHSAGVTVEHSFGAVDADEANAHGNSASDVHGIGSGAAVVGTTTTQTLTNKTVTGGTVNPTVLQKGGVNVPTVSETATLSNKTIDSANLTGTTTAATIAAAAATVAGDTVVTALAAQTLANKTLTAPNLTGGSLSGTLSGGTVDPSVLRQSGVQAVTVSDTQTLTNKTLTSPAINTPAIAAPSILDGAFTGTQTFAGLPTYSGYPLGVRYFPSVRSQVTSDSSSTSGTTALTVASLALTSVPLMDIELAFSWYALAPTSDSHRYEMSLWIDTVQYAAVSLKPDDSSTVFVDGGTVRIVTTFTGSATIYAKLARVSGTGTALLKASSTQRATLSARQFI